MLGDGKKKTMCKLWIFSTVILSTAMSYAQQNQIDFIGPLSPEFAQFGDFDVGVRTIEVIMPDAVDVLNTRRGEGTAFYERRLTLEVGTLQV